MAADPGSPRKDTPAGGPSRKFKPAPGVEATEDQSRALPTHVAFLQRSAGNAAVANLARLGGQQWPLTLQRAPGSAPTGTDAAGANEASAAIDRPVSGINKVGYIDNRDGSDIRTGPRESGGTALTQAPLPPATRVFVSGTHRASAGWFYVTAFLPQMLVRGYVQGLRVNTDLPEPLAKLHQVVEGDTAEKLAVQEFSTAVRAGHDLRYYENVLLFVNRDRNRDGVTGSYQDPGLLGSGANNVQLEAGHRIWLVSPAYAKALEGVVPDGSLTKGGAAKVKDFGRHVQDILASVYDSTNHLDDVAGEYAQAIRDNIAEIIAIVAVFIVAEFGSAFLAATPTGVGQAAAIVIQLALTAFGAKGVVEAGAKSLQHASQWLDLAWTANGKDEQITEASKEFLRMLVNIAMAALSAIGVKGNFGKALTIAGKTPTGGLPALAIAGGGRIQAPAAGGTRLGVPSPAGPTGVAMTNTDKGGGGPKPAAQVEEETLRKAVELERRVEEVADEKLMERLEKIDLSAPDSTAKLRALERDLSIVEEGPRRGTALDEGLSDRKTPGGPEPKQFASGNFAHRYLELLRDKLSTDKVPKKFQADLTSGRIITLKQMPDGLQEEVRIGETARVDRMGNTNVIYEVKPNTPGQIEKGLKRVEEYVQLANSKTFGGRSDWVGVVVIYNSAAARNFLP